MEEETFSVVEWIIENFSHWHSEIHDKVITSPKFSLTLKSRIELYPRGLSGKEEHLEVQLCWKEPVIFDGVVSFIGADGSILCTLEVKSNEKLKVVHLHSGPDFEEVVNGIRKNKALYDDRLTLRYRFRSRPNYVSDYMCTTIEVMDFCFKVSSELLQNTKLNTIFARLYYYLNEDDKRFVFLCIKRDELNNSKILLTLQPNIFEKKISILTSMTVLNNEVEVRTEESEHIFRDGGPWTFSNSLTFEELEEKDFSLMLNFEITPSIGYRQSFRVLTFQPNDFTTILPRKFRNTGKSVCEGTCSKSSTVQSSNQAGNSVTMLATELMCLYQDHDFSDFQLKCDNVTFPVHKNILSARSPVFKTMLATDMTESSTGSVDIEDLDVPTLSCFLTFLYSGTVDDLQSDSALKLYYAADKYQVPTLKKECVSVLCSEVSVSTVCDILSLAKRHQDDELTRVARDFILKNYNQVLGSEEWEGFMKSEPLLAVETLTHFAKSNVVGEIKN